jgi:hypothetical protein
LFEAEDDSLISGTKVKTFPACTLPKVTLCSVNGVSCSAKFDMKKDGTNHHADEELLGIQFQAGNEYGTVPEHKP